ncbi:MAG: tRNA dihydrouridine synthase DusB [Candidatus Omnitrophica bacterium]|nr:tRNA dihydrouridine synthase DusB [Candidatus Omnitrophota bacterium]
MTALFPRVILAPLSGVSSLPFRMLNRKAGCKFAFLEMLCARSLSYSSKKTAVMMLTEAQDKPLGVQLLGREPYYILKALEKLEGYAYDILDLNAACPQKKVTSRGKGAALLKCPKELQKLLVTIVREVSVPVTVKLRLGWDNDKNAVDIAKHAEDAGVKAVFVHGRTVADGYRSPVNYPAIRKIKAALKIPVVGSGDIWSAQMAKKMFDETGCDSITIARGALGNPWIFNEVGEFLATGKIIPRPAVREVAETMKRHLDLCLDFYGETGAIEFRKFYIWYTSGFSRVRPLRASVFCAGNKLEMTGLIEKFVAVAEG